MTNILLLSDNEDFRTDLKEQIELYTQDANVFEDKDDCVVFDAVIVDENACLAQNLQNSMRQTPIIFLKKDTDAEIPFMLTKPLRLEELLDTLVRSVNLFRRSQEGRIEFGNYILYAEQKEILNRRTGKRTKLTEREGDIISYLFKAKGKIVSKSELLSEVWGYNPEATTHTVETHIYRLRQKIEDDEPAIITEESGYTLNF
ncbi:MAG: response regulator transcription factor [Alphaproteobacteria bacterium]|nr:response regulator transcription factor [Alphaproteobacteria bacterium]